MNRIRLPLAVVPLICILVPGCRDSGLSSAKALLESGDFLSARPIYEKIIKNRPADFAAHYGLGMSFCAEAIYKTDLGLAEPHDWYPAIYQITVAAHLDTSPEVRRTLAILHYNLGTCYRKNGDVENAVLRISQALSYDSTLLKAYNLLGTLYHEQGDLEKAESCYRRTLIIKPDYAMAHFNMGALCWARQKYGDALRHFTDATACEPENRYFQTWLAKARERAGRN
ncbi:MAG: tetratricopeptide repeat protein [Chitinispirillaceae bacterium]|nr:tetratricopeptide repeat protein [Chitinispirillaceae bacterium]